VHPSSRIASLFSFAAVTDPTTLMESPKAQIVMSAQDLVIVDTIYGFKFPHFLWKLLLPRMISFWFAGVTPLSVNQIIGLYIGSI
jgi:hypothetical protein